jgi:hypothetical protein
VSRPSAWLAYAPDASESSFVTLFRAQAETAARDWGWSVEPLFAGLTDAEREAVEWFSHFGRPQNGPVIGKHAAALRGLLERLSPDRPDAIAEVDTTTPTEPAIPPAWLARPYWVDPAGGHRYGFPRLYDPSRDGDMTEWLIANGYPEHLARQELACTFTACAEDGEK